MNAMIRIFCWIIWAGFAGSALHAADDFNWESITDDDWADVGDSTISKSGAVMLFEKIVSDDRKMQNEKCTLTVYRRIRIFGEQGRVWGDAIIPNLHRKQRVPVILGRTILRDGTTVNLAPTQVFEKKVLQTKGLKIKQKSFSLPAISNDYIAEY